MNPSVERIEMTSIDEKGDQLVETIVMKPGNSEEAAFFTKEGDGIEVHETHLALGGVSIIIPYILNPRRSQPVIYH